MTADMMSVIKSIGFDTHENVVFHQTNLFSSAFPIIEEIRRQGKLCDVILKIEDVRISAHRIVLAATIPYFRAMFVHDMLESKQKEIVIDGIDAQALETLVNFSYNGRVAITNSNVQSLMLAASFLQLNEVRDACAYFLIDRCSAQNALGIKQFADTLGHMLLAENAEKYIELHFREVSLGEEFNVMDARSLADLLRKDSLHVHSEEVVFEAVMRWVRRDVSRRQHLPLLLAHVRMPLLCPQYLSDKVAKEEVIRSSHSCRDLVDEARDCHLMPERRSLLPSFKTRPRYCNSIAGHIFAIGGLAKSGDSLSTVEAFDPVSNKWVLAEAMSMLRSRVGVAVLRNRLYAIGGYNGLERLATVEVFDPLINTWSQVAPMHCKRSAMGATSLKDCLFVCGGYDGVTSLNTVERYFPDLNSWTLVAPMMKSRSAGGVLAFDGYVYALGGHNGLSIFDLVERFDPDTGKWTEVTPMLTNRCRLGVAALNGKLYVCGGYDGSAFLQTVEMFDPKTNIWTNVAPMNTKRSRVALVANMGRLWAIGGYDGESNLSSVEVYDPETNIWTFTDSMCAHEGGVGVGVILMPSK